MGTPKGLWLTDHYGTSTWQDKYGPKGSPSQTRETGKIYANNREKIFMTKSNICIPTRAPYYQLCHGLGECDICMSSPHCGWCTAKKVCRPKSLMTPACSNDCVSNWIVLKWMCPIVNNSVKSGKMTNVAPEAKTLKSPHLRGPAIHMYSTSDYLGVSQQDVKLGYTTKKMDLGTTHPNSGLTHYSKVNIVTPMKARVYHPYHIKSRHYKTFNEEPNLPEASTEKVLLG